MPRRKTPPRVAAARPAITRRGAARAAAAGSARRAGPQVNSRVAIGKLWQRYPGLRPRGLRLQARRPDDLLLFRLLGHNLRIAPDAPARLVRIDPLRSATLVIELPPQHFGEEAWLDATGQDVSSDTLDPPLPEVTDDPDYKPKNAEVKSNAEPIPPLPAARMRMARPSRLAFTMPPDVDNLPLSYAAVLEACRSWPMALSVLAQPDPKSIFAEIDPGWLQQVTQGAAWLGAAERLGQVLAERAPRGVGRAVSRSAATVARAMARHNSRVAPSVAQARVKEALEAELTILQRRYRGLGGRQNRDLLQANVVAQAARGYARLAPRFSLDKLARFPDITLLLSPHQPPDTVTALELPYRLITSPIPPARWRHRDEVVTHRGRTELWHTRLSADDAGATDSSTGIRAIWSPDYGLDDIIDVVNGPLPYRMSLDALDREMLVKLMAGYNLRVHRQRMYRPRSSDARRLILSALGGLLDAEGNWDPLVNPAGVDLEQWRHLASLGRDQYVRVVYRGFLYPFGHSASLIKVTERKFENHLGDSGKRIAVLRQRFFIVVREAVREFDGGGHAHDGRNFPFTEVEVLTRVTPSLLAPEKPGSVPAPDGNLFGTGVAHRECFWPSLSASNPFRFELRLRDLEGGETTLALPLLFVGQAANEQRHADIRDVYNQSAEARRSGDAGGQDIAFAPVAPNPVEGGDTRLPTRELRFASAQDSSAGFREARTYPEVEEAEVAVAAVQRMLGKPDAGLRVKYFQAYRDGGFDGANPGEVFLEAAAAALELGFGENLKSDAIGALASPNMDIGGLSRLVGPAGDIANIANDSFDPAQFFKGAELLGGIKIEDIIGVVAALTNAEAPQMLTRELPERVEASFEWETEVTDSDPLGLLVPGAGGTTLLSINSLASSPINQPSAATFETQASLVNFKVNLFDFITIWFDRLQFEARAGSKPDVLVDLHPQDAVMFGGPLEFVNQLKDVIPMDGFSDPPNLAVTPSGLTASYSLGLPDIQVGLFALSNLSIGAGFSLPFDSRPINVRFNFCERQSPFSLTVSMFGGGGFFLIGVGAKGVQEIEAALEFGAAVAINLGVASGGVEVKAGVYFHWLDDSVELSGYVRLHGELSVIGLISVSLTFNLQLSYLKEGNESVVWGEATIVVEVEVLVFSASVDVQCRREFAGSESDPTFLDLVPEKAAWVDYCEAFAEEAA